MGVFAGHLDPDPDELQRHHVVDAYRPPARRRPSTGRGGRLRCWAAGRRASSPPAARRRGRPARRGVARPGPRACGLRWRSSGRISCSYRPASRSADVRHARRWRASTPARRKPHRRRRRSRPRRRRSRSGSPRLALDQPNSSSWASCSRRDRRHRAQLVAVDEHSRQQSSAPAARRPCDRLARDRRRGRARTEGRRGRRASLTAGRPRLRPVPAGRAPMAAGATRAAACVGRLGADVGRSPSSRRRGSPGVDLGRSRCGP